MIALAYQGLHGAKMALRQVGIICAMTYGLLLAFVFVSQSWYYGFSPGDYWRPTQAFIVLLAAAVVVAGRSSLWIVVVMSLILLRDPEQVVFTLPMMLLGRYNFAPGTGWYMLFLVLPLLAVLSSLGADGRLQRFVSYIRRFPSREY